MRVLDSPQQRLKYIFETTVKIYALSEEDRPQHQDHYSALFDKFVGSFKSPIECGKTGPTRSRKGLPFADIRAKPAPSSQLF